MKLDNIDLEIISIIYNGDKGDEFTTSYLAKKVYQPEDKSKIKNLDPKIRQRLEKMSKYGIIKVDDEGTKTYRLRQDKIIYGQADIDVETELEEIEKSHFQFCEREILFVENDEGFYVSAYIPHQNQDKQQERQTDINRKQHLSL